MLPKLMPRFRFTDRDGVEVCSGVGVDGMDDSMGETGVSVGTMGVDVGELQEDSRNKAVTKEHKRRMAYIICEIKTVERIAPLHRRIVLRRLVPS